MQIKILFDSVALDNTFSTGWGISYVINDTILFDAGETPSSLVKNMKNMNVEISNIKTVVISHDHWDHRGGLWGLLRKNPKLKVYACPNFSEKFKRQARLYNSRLIETKRFTMITDNIYTTGEIPGEYAPKYIPEQSLVLKTHKGTIIITGCAHPGIVEIIENVKLNISDDIYLVLGGFHLMGKHRKTIEPVVDKFRQLGIKKIAPSHCTGKIATAIFKERYGDDFIEVKIGQEIRI